MLREGYVYPETLVPHSSIQKFYNMKLGFFLKAWHKNVLGGEAWPAQIGSSLELTWSHFLGLGIPLL